MSKLDIRELSGVDHPAHEEEGWLEMLKAADLDPEVEAEIDARLAAVLKQAAEEIEDGDGNEPVVKVGRKYSAGTVEKLTAIRNGIDVLLAEAAPKETDVTDEEVQKQIDEAVAKAVEAKDAEIAEKDAAITELTEKVEKSVETEENEIVTSLRKEISEANERAVAAETKAETERVRREDAEWVEKAKAFRVGSDNEELGKALRKLHETDAESTEVVTKALTAAGAAIVEGKLVTEFGSEGAGASDSESKIDALAKSKAKEDGITFEKAYAAVLETDEGKALYNAAQSEKGR